MWNKSPKRDIDQPITNRPVDSARAHTSSSTTGIPAVCPLQVGPLVPHSSASKSSERPWPGSSSNSHTSGRMLWPPSVQKFAKNWTGSGPFCYLTSKSVVAGPCCSYMLELICIRLVQCILISCCLNYNTIYLPRCIIIHNYDIWCVYNLYLQGVSRSWKFSQLPRPSANRHVAVGPIERPGLIQGEFWGRLGTFAFQNHGRSGHMPSCCTWDSPKLVGWCMDFLCMYVYINMYIILHYITLHYIT